MLSTGAIFLGCASQPSEESRPPNASDATRPATVQERSICDPGSEKGLRILDEELRPVDMTNEQSIMAAAGRPVMLCAPVRRLVSGRVIDGSSNSPVRDAAVTVESWQTYPPIGGLSPNRRLISSVEVKTDAAGHWLAPGESRWMRGILAADGFPYFVSSYCVHAPGYTPVLFDPWKNGGAVQEADVSEIRMQRGANGMPESNAAGVSRCGVSLGPAL
jgi:hypothetical protein